MKLFDDREDAVSPWSDPTSLLASDASKLAIAAVLILVPLAMLTTGTWVTYPGILVLLLEVGILYLVYSLIILGLNVQYGYTGLVNFGPVLFFALGMYGTAIISAEASFRGTSYGMPWLVGVAVGVLLAGLVGVAVGVTTIKLRDDFLGIVTLAAAEIFYTATQTLSFLGGSFPITGVPQIIHDAAATSEMGILSTFLIYAGIVVIVYTAVSRLVNSPYGRTMRAIRADEEVVKSIGKNPLKTKIIIFAFGAMLAGFGGALFALSSGSAIPSQAFIIVTMIVWVSMLAGGPGNNLGVMGGLAIIMGVQLTTRWLNAFVPSSGTTFGALRLIVLGGILIVIIRYRPEGLWGDANRLGRYEE